MKLTEQLQQHRLELLNTQSQIYDLEARRKELIVIVQALELGVKREEELLKNTNNTND